MRLSRLASRGSFWAPTRTCSARCSSAGPAGRRGSWPRNISKVYSHLNPLIEAGRAAGAHAVYLSGAGPTVMAVTSGAAGDVFAQRSTERTEIKVANAMVEVAKKHGHLGKVFITRPVTHGAYIASAEPPFSTAVVRYPGGL